jgi:hypothetical protein
MTPSLPDLLMGHMIALSTPMPPEATGDYLVGRLGLLAMISILAVQEAERGVDTRVWENKAIRSILQRAGAGAPCEPAEDLTWSALDRENAQLRRALIAAHTSAEDRGDTALGREILGLYHEMAGRRQLVLPPTS